MRTPQRVEQFKQEVEAKKLKALARAAREQAAKAASSVAEFVETKAKAVVEAMNDVVESVVAEPEVELPPVAAEEAPAETAVESLDSTPPQSEDTSVEAAPSTVTTSTRKRK